jgi:thymidine kinase
MDAAMADPEKSKVVGVWLAQKYGVRNWAGMSRVAREAWSKYPKYDDVTCVIALMATLPRAPKPEAVAGLCARFADDNERPALMAALAADPRVLVGDKHWVLHSQLIREDEIRTRATKLLTVSTDTTGESAPSRVFPSMSTLIAPVDQLLQRTDGAALCVISGVAGGGKTHSLTHANRQWNVKGVRVWATARNRLTAAETGVSAGASEFRSLSTTALRHRIALDDSRSSSNKNLHNKWGDDIQWNVDIRALEVPMPGDVLIVDELGLLDHADIEMILTLAESGVMVKALGDAHQIQPIDGSTSARLLLDIAEDLGMPTLDETRRCKPWKEIHDPLRDVVTGDSDPEQVLGLLDIRSAAKIEEIIEIVNGFQDSQVVVQSNELRCQIAQCLPRPEMEMLPGTQIPNVVMLRDSIAGWVGDAVVVRRNFRSYSSSDGLYSTIYNGQKGRIEKVDPDEVVIAGNGYRATISRKVAEDCIALGGVHTGDSAQGQTFQRSVVVVTGMETREWLYSAASRGRDAPIFVALSQSDDASSVDDARSVVEHVLSREGVAQTVAEMCKSDPTLAKSVAEVRGENSGSNGGPSDFACEATSQHYDIQQSISQQSADSDISDQADITDSDKAKPKTSKTSNKIFGNWEDPPVSPSSGPKKIKDKHEQDYENWQNRKTGFPVGYGNSTGRLPPGPPRSRQRQAYELRVARWCR